MFAISNQHVGLATFSACRGCHTCKSPFLNTIWCLQSQPISRHAPHSLLIQQASRLKTHQNDTFKESHDALAEKIHEAGISSPAADCYRDHNYAVVQVIPIWLCCVIEKFRAYRTGLKQEPMFSKVYGQEVKYDSSRTLINCAKDGFLWFLISSMVTLAMAKHGFLMAVCSTSQRVARVVTYIESTGGSDSKVQAWHEDFCNAMAGYFQHEFGFSVLVSCLGGSIVDIVEGTYGQSVSK